MLFRSQLLVVISAGYKNGLPLANGNQAGIVATGLIWNCVGNWIGTELVLDFLAYPTFNAGIQAIQGSTSQIIGLDFGSPKLSESFQQNQVSPNAYTLKWPAVEGQNQTLIQALSSFFQSQFGCKVVGTLNSKLNTPPPGGFELKYTTLAKFAGALKDASLQIVQPPNSRQQSNEVTTQSWQDYLGVSLGYDPQTGNVIAWDGTDSQNTNVLELQKQEFIGQPTWVAANGSVQSVFPMRSDIKLGMKVKFPDNIPNIVPGQISVAGGLGNTLLSAAGETLYATNVRHVGKYRDPSPTGWCTYLDSSSALFKDPINTSNPNSVSQG